MKYTLTVVEKGFFGRKTLSETEPIEVELDGGADDFLNIAPLGEARIDGMYTRPAHLDIVRNGGVGAGVNNWDAVKGEKDHEISRRSFRVDSKGVARAKFPNLVGHNEVVLEPIPVK